MDANLSDTDRRVRSGVASGLGLGVVSGPHLPGREQVRGIQHLALHTPPCPRL